MTSSYQNALKYLSFFALLVVFTGCNHERQHDVENYHQLVSKAELAICDEDFREALDNYGLAFRQTKRPFATDVYNAALAAQAQGTRAERDQYLQDLIDGSDDLEFIKYTFLSNFMTVQEWEILETNRERKYDATLRAEMAEMGKRNRKRASANESGSKNTDVYADFQRLQEISNASSFPSHIEIGYSENLRRQPHHQVLRSVAELKYTEDTSQELEPLLRTAVDEGRLDPELALFYLNLYGEAGKGPFELYRGKQFSHVGLPGEMITAFWVTRLDKTQKDAANSIRKSWYADQLEDIEPKAVYSQNSTWPFIFTSVRKSVTQLDGDLSKEKALEQYNELTKDLKAAK